MSTLPVKPVAQRAGTLVSRLLGVSVGIGLGVFLGNWLVFVSKQVDAGGYNAALKLCAYIGAALILLLTILVHELGHWIGSGWVGFRRYAIAVMWLHLERKDAKWKLRVGEPPEGVLGFVQALPVDAKNLRTRQAIYVLAGPVANLATGLLALWLNESFYVHTLLTEQASLAAFSAVQGVHLFSYLSLFLALTNLLPLTPRTDGTKLLQIWQGGAAWQRLASHQLILSAIYQRIRPREWERSWVTHLLAQPDQSATQCLGYYYAYMYALDTHEREEAQVYLQSAISLENLAKPGMKRHLFCEAVYCVVVLAKDVQRAQYWFDCANQIQAFMPDEVPFTRSVLAYGLQDYTEAFHWLRKSEAQVAELPETSSKAQAIEHLVELRNLIEQSAICRDNSFKQLHPQAE